MAFLYSSALHGLSHLIQALQKTGGAFDQKKCIGEIRYESCMYFPIEIAKSWKFGTEDMLSYCTLRISVVLVI